jgi:hypothetical protein
MLEHLKAAWNRLTAGSAGADVDPATVTPIEYKGYRIRPAPYRTDGQYQTAGIIDKDTPEGVKEHRFVRADTHPSREAAVDFAIAKAKQIIDLQGDRMFAEQG